MEQSNQENNIINSSSVPMPRIVPDTTTTFAKDLIVPPIVTSEQAADMERIIDSHGMNSRLLEFSRTAHLATGDSTAQLNKYLMNQFSIKIDIESVHNIFLYINRRSDYIRKSLSRSTEESGLDRAIDTGLLQAMDDIVVGYNEQSNKVKGMGIDDPNRSIEESKLKDMRKEMLQFKKIISPAIEKIDVLASIQKAESGKNALVEAVNLLDKSPKRKSIGIGIKND
jgi:hypothetical protein